MSNDQKDYLYSAVADLVDYANAKSNGDGLRVVLDAFACNMSEDNLHEIIASISEMWDYPTGISFWYGDRGNFVDREFWDGYPYND